MDSRLGLPKNTVLDGSYRIERVIGSGGFGVTYWAEDVNLGTAVALKEYYPAEFGERDPTMSVRPKSDRHKKTFEWGRASFLQEARTLARFRHPSIVRVTRVFEANSTAYMVMEFEEGQSLQTWLENLGRPPTQSELDRIVAPLLDALQVMHAADFLHRDIAPDNIIVRPDGTPVLLDFGSARRAVAEMSRSLTGVVKAGYSPHEQYAADGRLQGPWTDFYALGATLYRAVSGHSPEESTLRMTDDRMRPATKVGSDQYRPGFLAAIDACLKVIQTDRPQSVAQLRPMLLGEVAQPTDTRRIDDAPTDPKPLPRLARRSVVRTWFGISAAILVLFGGVYVGLEYTRRNSAEKSADAADAKRRAEDEARRKADAAQRQVILEAESEVKRKEEEARRQDAMETARRNEEEEARRNAEQEAKREADAASAKKKADEAVLAKAREPIRIVAPASVNKNCASDPPPNVSVTSAPKHGKITFGVGFQTLRHVAHARTKPCIGARPRARVVYYVPTVEPVTTDNVSFNVVTVGGDRMRLDCIVHPQERSSDSSVNGGQYVRYEGP